MNYSDTVCDKCLRTVIRNDREQFIYDILFNIRLMSTVPNMFANNVRFNHCSANIAHSLFEPNFMMFDPTLIFAVMTSHRLRGPVQIGLVPLIFLVFLISF